MLQPLLRTVAAIATIAIFCLAALPAHADGLADIYQRTIVPGANTAISNAMEQTRKEQQARRQQVAPGAVAQVPPAPQEPVSQQVGLPAGLTYTADLSMAVPFGNIGSFGRQGWLYGGGDALLAYGFNPTTRLVASMYQLQHWPYGFNSGFAPVYLAGFRNPVGCADLSGANGCGPGTGRNINVRTKDTFGVFMLEKMVFPLAHLGVPLPLVISPTYVARGGVVGFSPNNNDIVPFSYNPPDGPVVNDLAVRTAQFYAVAVTLPFLKTPKMFGTFTLATQWLVHKAGVNGPNSFQTPQVLYLEYTPTKTTTIWAEPQSARDYLPTDPYPEHLIAYFFGVSQRVSRYGFMQLVLNSGGPTNLGTDGITFIKCLTVQQAINSTCGIGIGGLKATQLQLQFGVGSPAIFPL